MNVINYWFNIFFVFTVGHFSEDRRATEEEAEQIKSMREMGLSAGKIAQYFTERNSKHFTRHDINNIVHKQNRSLATNYWKCHLSDVVTAGGEKSYAAKMSVLKTLEKVWRAGMEVISIELQDDSGKKFVEKIENGSSPPVLETDVASHDVDAGNITEQNVNIVVTVPNASIIKTEESDVSTTYVNVVVPTTTSRGASNHESCTIIKQSVQKNVKDIKNKLAAVIKKRRLDDVH